MILLSTFIFSYWFYREFSLFTIKINRQVYQDYCFLQKNESTLDAFLTTSSLTPKSRYYAYSFYFLFPLCICLFEDYTIPIKLITILLIYLSLVDYCYYLTDSYYVYTVFLLSILQCLLYTPAYVIQAMSNLLIFSCFFLIFIPLTQWFFKKEGLGIGDVFLLLALSPLFSLEQMISLILMASLFGLVFSIFYFCRFQRKINRLPFIPFITFSTFLLFLVTLSPNIN